MFVPYSRPRAPAIPAIHKTTGTSNTITGHPFPERKTDACSLFLENSFPKDRIISQISENTEKRRRTGACLFSSFFPVAHFPMPLLQVRFAHEG